MALVTGASSGIGAAIARQLRDCGAQVVITGRNQKTLDASAARIGERCLPLVGDVSRREDMEAIVRTIEARFGRLDIVVANAASAPTPPAGEITDEKFETVIGANLRGVLNTVQTALPLLKEGASVLLIGSTASYDAPQTMSVYGAAKAGLRAFTTTWVKDLAGRGIRINTLSHGAIDTPSLRKAMEAETDESRVQPLAERSPLKRIGSPEEVARVVAFFASDHAATSTASSFTSTAA